MRSKTIGLAAAATVALVAAIGVGTAFAQTDEPMEQIAAAAPECFADGWEQQPAGDVVACLKERMGSFIGKARMGFKGRGDFQPAEFEATDGQVSGEHVSFTVDEATGAVLEYTAKDGENSTLLFDAIRVADAGEVTYEAEGGRYTATAEGYTWRAMNVPAAAWHLRATSPTTVEFDIADGLTLERETDDEGTLQAIRVKDGDNTLAVLGLKGTGTLAIDGDVVTATLEEGGVGFHLDGEGKPCPKGERGPGGHGPPGGRMPRGGEGGPGGFSGGPRR